MPAPSLAAAALALLLLAQPLRAQPYPAGVTAALSDGALNYLVAQLLPSLAQKIGAISIPDIHGSQDGFDYSLTAIKCAGFNFGPSAVTLQPPAALAVALSDIAVACTTDWHFNLHSWPHFPSGSGSADAAVSQTTAALAVAFSASALRPTLRCPSASLSIGKVDISFHGDNALDWLLNLFKSQIEGAIRGALDGAFGPVVAAFINEDGNAFLATIPIAVPIAARAPYNISEARFGFVAAPAATPALFTIAVQGDAVPLGFTGVPPVAAPAIPAFGAGAAARMIEGRFSPYLLTSAAWTYASARLLQWSVPAAAMPLGLNSSAAYALIAPGLPAAFPGDDVSLALSVGEADAVAVGIAPAGIAAGVVIEFDFLVRNGTQLAFSLLANTSLALGVGVRPDAAHPGSLVFNGTLAYLNTQLALGNSTVGKVSVGLLQGLADLVLVRGRGASGPRLRGDS